MCNKNSTIIINININTMGYVISSRLDKVIAHLAMRDKSFRVQHLVKNAPG